MSDPTSDRDGRLAKLRAELDDLERREYDVRLERAELLAWSYGEGYGNLRQIGEWADLGQSAVSTLIGWADLVDACRRHVGDPDLRFGVEPYDATRQFDLGDRLELFAAAYVGAGRSWLTWGDLEAAASTRPSWGRLLRRPAGRRPARFRQ